MSKMPYMKLFIDDFLGGVTRFTVSQIGAYVMLLMEAWASDDGTIPDDDHILARIVHTDAGNWKQLKPAVMAKFRQLPDGRYYNHRMMKERQAARLPVANVAVGTGNHGTGNHGTGNGMPFYPTKTKDAVQHPRASARALPESIYKSYCDVLAREGAPSPATRTAATARPTQAPVSEANPRPPEERARQLVEQWRTEATGQRQTPLDVIKASAKRLPMEGRPINAVNLSPEELAAKETEAIAYIQSQTH